MGTSRRKTERHETEAMTRALEASDQLPGCVLYVDKGQAKDKGRFLSLRQGTARVGTSRGCDLQLHDAKVSRFHAEFAVSREGISFTDLSSTNGTYYLGSKIDKALLKHGAHLTLGKTTLAVLPLPEGEGIEPDTSIEYGRLCGVSPALRRVFAVLRKLEESEAPILIHGETGTGKELVAQTVHEKSPRKGGPLVVLDCGSVARDLADSELFGHVRGAFTGADSDRAGVFEEANAGTLFLDEIAELPLSLQPRLLRALEARQVRRVGDNKYRNIDVRIVAGTHRHLGEAVKSGHLREDLYYRLAVVCIHVPPLRERPEDIPILAQHLARTIGGADKEPLPDEVLNLMLGHDWPGNVRELRNAVHRLISLGDFSRHPDAIARKQCAVSDFGADVDPSVPYKQAKERLLGSFEAAYVKAILDRFGGNISRASRSAGIARRYFKELMHKHKLSSDGDDD